MPVKVKFPPDKLSGEPGFVTLALDVDENGSLANVRVEKSSDPKCGTRSSRSSAGMEIQAWLEEWCADLCIDLTYGFVSSTDVRSTDVHGYETLGALTT